MLNKTNGTVGRMDKHTPIDELKAISNRITKEFVENEWYFASPHEAYGKLAEEFSEVMENIEEVEEGIDNFKSKVFRHGTLESMILNSYYIRDDALKTAKELLHVAAMAELNIQCCTRNKDRYKLFPIDKEERYTYISDREEYKRGLDRSSFDEIRSLQNSISRD